jgi:hypothetical protein
MVAKMPSKRTSYLALNVRSATRTTAGLRGEALLPILLSSAWDRWDPWDEWDR